MITIKAEVRKDQGKGASRRLRSAGKFPAIVYGGSEAPLSIELDHDTVKNQEIKEGFYGETVILSIDGKEVHVKVQAVQRHVFKPKLTHIDFIRV
ncbi:50S ribosomal protein L25 [Pectobacterium cacticida]|uniref:Large ribosomal subunit protein bL25 n=1 Tax=Pectobacterium cacticida TaxID=69221 RepID=A0ABZ2G7X6_9GAMM|nr:50S ribosomal protein L25 [Pectobacterium cacticida]UYX08117.1 50S ribosomal protein L25 [Pectobacterium cacticida]